MAAIFYPPRWQHSRCQIAVKFSIYAELRTISISFQLLSFPRALSSYVRRYIAHYEDAGHATDRSPCSASRRIHLVLSFVFK